MKNKITDKLIAKNLRLIAKNLKLKKEIYDLRRTIGKLQNENDEIRSVNYEISSNLNYLIELRKKTNKRVRKLKIENEELKKDKKEVNKK